MCICMLHETFSLSMTHWAMTIQARWELMRTVPPAAHLLSWAGGLGLRSKGTSSFPACANWHREKKWLQLTFTAASLSGCSCNIRVFLLWTQESLIFKADAPDAPSNHTSSICPAEGASYFHLIVMMKLKLQPDEAGGTDRLHFLLSET